MPIITMTNTGAWLSNADGKAIAVVNDALSYDDESVQRKSGLAFGRLNSKQSFLRKGSLSFEAGFVPLVRQALQEASYPVSIDDRRTALDCLGPAINLDEPTGHELADDGKLYPVYGGYLNGISLRDYQASAVERFVLERRGIIQAATGGGKTEIAAAITKRVGRRTLFLTHKLDLVGQTRARFKARLGLNTGAISEGSWMTGDITVATVQTIMSHAKRDPEMVRAFLLSVELLIVDEAHRSSGNSFFTIISACENAYYRANLTATPLMKGKREDDLRLIATSGNIICRITNAELIRRGVLAQPYFRFNQVPGFGFSESRVRRELKNEGKRVAANAIFQAAYRQGIVENDLRNRMIVEDTNELVAEGRKTVVLFLQQDHGERLHKMLRASGTRCALLYGKDDVDEREIAKRRLREGDIDVMIASTILDEGIDEPCISGIVLAGGGKSKISLFQRVGRSVRRKVGEELERLGNTARIIDYIDTGSKHLKTHSALRFRAVRLEDGWIVEDIHMFEDRYRKAA